MTRSALPRLSEVKDTHLTQLGVGDAFWRAPEPLDNVRDVICHNGVIIDTMLQVKISIRLQHKALQIFGLGHTDQTRVVATGAAALEDGHAAFGVLGGVDEDVFENFARDFR